MRARRARLCGVEDACTQVCNCELCIESNTIFGAILGMPRYYTQSNILQRTICTMYQSALFMNAQRSADWRHFEPGTLGLGGRTAAGSALPDGRAGWRRESG